MDCVEWSKSILCPQQLSKLKNLPVAIITRATLRPQRLLSFWRAVPKASKAIEAAHGVLYYKGIGRVAFYSAGHYKYMEFTGRSNAVCL